MDSFFWYHCDTAPGSSGSPVFNDSWQVVALHHGGVPDRKVEDGVPKYRTRSSGYLSEAEIIRRNLTQDIIWVANEGVRISRIVKHLADEQDDDDKGESIGEFHNDAMELNPFANVMPGVSIVRPPLGEMPELADDIRAPRREDPDLGDADRGSENFRDRTRTYYRGRKGYDEFFWAS